MSGGATRILLARRASRRDLAVVFEPDAFRLEGARRRIAYRDVHGLERAGPRLWVGAGLVPAVLGGRQVPPAQLAAVEAELRARIGALPDAARRLARLDARRAARPHRPWLALALAAALAAALATTDAAAIGLATDLLLLLGAGLLAESWLGARALLAAGAAALLAAGLVEPPATAGGLAAFAVRGLPAGWVGLAAFARLLREAELSVRARSALELVAPLALVLAVHALASGASPLPLALAALAGFAVAPLVLASASP